MNPTIPASLLVCALASVAARAAPVSVVSFQDARGDDRGPGSYQYPTNPSMVPAGALDLRSFEVLVDGDDVIFKVGLGAVIRRPSMPPRRQLGSTELVLDNTMTAQNVDIYIDTHGGRGFTETVPGRNVLIRADDAWDVAVILTPQPAVTRSLVRDWAPAPQTLFATGVKAEGATLIARIPRSVLGDLPQKHWGYTVLVTGALWEYSFSVVDRTLGGRTINAFTMPVAPVPEALVIGGAPLSRYAPAVMDLPVPAGMTQNELLRTTDDAMGLVSIPLVYPHGVRPPFSGPAAPDPTAPGGPRLDAALLPSSALAVNAGVLELVVADVNGDLVILSRPAEGAASADLAPHRVGTVVSDGGAVEGRIVVTAIHDGFIVATAIEGKGRLRKGQRVQFEPASPPR